MPIANYTTQVKAEQSAAEIAGLLAAYGARAVLTEYDDNHKVEALSFKVRGPSGADIAFRLPLRPDALFRLLQRESDKGRVPRRFAGRDHAYNVAWRIAKDWIRAQMALLETEMVSLEQLFLPYAIVRGDKTLGELISELPLMLSGGETPDA